MFGKISGRPRSATPTFVVALAGGILAGAASVLLTLCLSLLLCLGVHPEAAISAEWMTSVAAALWAGALVRRRGRGASIGVGLVLATAWALGWLFLMARFTPHKWLAEALPTLSHRHILAWACAPMASFAGGEIGAFLPKLKWLRRLILGLVPPILVLTAGYVHGFFVMKPGVYQLQQGITMKLYPLDKDGNALRLFTIDFTENPKLRMGIYDCDAYDTTPYDNFNTTYFGTPAGSIIEKLGPDTSFVVNGGYYNWKGNMFTASHIAPMVLDGQAYYNVFTGKSHWAFGWKTVDGKLQFKVEKDVPFDKLTQHFDAAFDHVRALVVDGKPVDILPGSMGAPFLNCSRVSLGWSDDNSKLYILIVRGRDSERASINRYRFESRKTSGWDIMRVRQWWLQMGIKNAIALDAGDSTQVMYRESDGDIRSVSSGRIAYTFGYLMDKPLKLWLPILPTRHSHTGVLNYIFVQQAH